MPRILPSCSAPLAPGRRRVVGRLLFAAGGLAVGILVGFALALLPPALVPAPPPRVPTSLPVLGPAPPPPPPTTLAPGLKFPPLTSRWLNGPRPTRLAAAPGRVTVVDVWADW